MKKQTTENILATIVVLVAFGFVFHQLISGWSKLQAEAALWEFAPGYLLLSVLLVFVNFLMSAAAYRWFVIALGQKLTFRASFYIFFTSQIGRYVPGKVWVFVGQAYLANKHGLSKSAAATGGVYHFVVGSLAGLFLISIMLLVKFSTLPVFWLLFLFALCLLIILLFAPSWLEKTLNPLLEKKGRAPISFVLPKSTILFLVIWLMGAWIVSAASFIFLTAAVTTISFAQALTIGMVFIAGYILGLMVFFVPGGLGVREGFLVSLLPFSPSVASVLAIASRLLITLIEIAAFFIAQVIAPKLTAPKETGTEDTKESEVK